MIDCKTPGRILAKPFVSIVLSSALVWPALADSSDRGGSGISLEVHPPAITAFQHVPGLLTVGGVLVTLDTGKGVGGDRVEFCTNGRGRANMTVVDHGDGTYTQRFWASAETGPMQIEALVNDEVVPVTATVDVVEEWGGPLDMKLAEFFPFNGYVLSEGSTDPVHLTLLLYDSFGNLASPDLGNWEEDVELTVSRGTLGEVEWKYDSYNAIWQPGPELGTGTVSATVNDEAVEQIFTLNVVDETIGFNADWTEDYEQHVIYQGSEIDLTVQVLDQNGVPLTTGGDTVFFRVITWGSFTGTAIDHQDGTYSGRFKVPPYSYDSIVSVYVNGRRASEKMLLNFTPDFLFEDSFELVNIPSGMHAK
jgi:hypothetical protein